MMFYMLMEGRSGVLVIGRSLAVKCRGLSAVETAEQILQQSVSQKQPGFRCQDCANRTTSCLPFREQRRISAQNIFWLIHGDDVFLCFFRVRSLSKHCTLLSKNMQ